MSGLARSHPRRSLPPTGGGKEELRATLLKPYLLRLRAERGEPAVRALLATVGVPGIVLDDDGAWISVAAMRRALGAIAGALGERALAERGEWMTHAETLGGYVRMLRVASTPLDAYQYLAANSAESTRVGTYEVTVFGRGRVQIAYTPRADTDSDSDQTDQLLCLARKAELSSVPRIWGLGDARVDDVTCLARGDSTCKYAIRFGPAHAQYLPLGFGAGALACGGAVAASGSWFAAAIATAVGGGLGAVIGMLLNRVAAERRSHVFEKNRIAALERGLEARGQFREAGELTGATLGGKYRIIRKIGSGGIGSVYAAEHVALGLQVAIKLLRGAAAADAAEIARLRREAQVQVSIEHPNVIRTLDLDQLPDGSIYVVMELLHGESVAERLKRNGPLAPGFAIPVFVQVCRALAAAHQLGIVHRDLKPGNVFICDDRSVKVLDFGMSKFGEAETLTQEGYTLGTPEYMSPEQCIGAAVEPRTDIYAFGVLMYEALTGDLPIRGRQRRELLELHQRMVPLNLRDCRPDLDIPAELDQAVMACLRKRIADRPSARELERLLASVATEGLVFDYPEGTPRRGATARRTAQ